MLRIVLLVGNVGLLISSIIFTALAGFNVWNNNTEVMSVICYMVFMPLALVNIHFIRSIYSGSVSLSIKRKKLEEEIKIQEAENRLKDLQSQRSDSLKEKNKNGII